MVADAVQFEPVSAEEMGKIMGNSLSLSRAREKNAEKHCGTGITVDSQVEK